MLFRSSCTLLWLLFSYSLKKHLPSYKQPAKFQCMKILSGFMLNLEREDATVIWAPPPHTSHLGKEPSFLVSAINLMIKMCHFDVQGPDEFALAGRQAANQPVDANRQRWKKNKPLVG